MPASAVKKILIYLLIFLNNELDLAYSTYLCDFHLLTFTIL